MTMTARGLASPLDRDRSGRSRTPNAPGAGCGEPAGTITHWRNFTDSGRHFHTLVRVGPDALPSAAEQAWRILDSLRLDPDARPDWPATG